MSKKTNQSRRDFLSNASLMGASAMVPAPFERLLDLMTRGFISKAQADAAGATTSRNYIGILMAGAPSRYVFDHWMRTNASDPQMQFNPMVATKYINSGGVAGGLEYSTFNYKNVLVPHMFSHSVFKGDGSKRPLTDYLNNMLVIRGFASGLDGHQFNANLQQSPVGGTSSLTGLAADYSQKTFEAIQWPDRGSYRSYTSSKSKALNIVSGGQPIHNLLAGFGNPSPGLEAARNLKNRQRAAFDLAQDRLKTYIKSDSLGASNLGLNLSNASTLMKKGVGSLDSYWGPAFARYKYVIEASMRESGLAGISDMALISAQNAQWNVHVASGNRGLTLSSGADLRTSIASMVAADFLAEGLALAEYVLKENLVSSIDLMAGNFNNLALLEAGTGALAIHTMITDMHETGCFPSVILNTAYYRGLTAGLLELADQLKKTTVNGTDVWSNTVVQVLSDFGRSARSAGSGSDHGFNQLVTSVFSGAVQNGPFVVGNIRVSGNDPAVYAGTQGVAQAIDGYNQSGQPTPVMAASTVAELLNVTKNPYENLAAPLVDLNGSTLTVKHAAKLVAV
jgi:Protein of unknown function (DUF1501).